MPEVPDTVDDAIAPLVSPSTDEVFEATRPFSAREIASAAASEAIGGGGGLPSQWTIGEHGELEVATDDLDTGTIPLILTLPVSPHNMSDVGALVTAVGQRLIEIAGSGATLRLKPYPGEGDDALIVQDAEGDIVLAPAATRGDYSIIRRPHIKKDPGHALVESDGDGNGDFAVLEGGAIVTRQHVAPVDDDLVPGDLAMWFDQTDGAAKAMFKAKTADGTVASGQVALS